MKLTRLIAVACLSLMPISALAQQDQPVLVELFTSQGCSSCPPADAFMEKLARKPGVVALAFHVDYWDYLGWKDSLGSPEYTRRQRNYAHAMQKRMVFTPQMVVEGVSSATGSDVMKVMDQINYHKTQADEYRITLARNGNRLSIEAHPMGTGSEALKFHLFRYLPATDVPISRGENRGRTVRYVNAVTDWDVIGDWNGHGRYQKTIRVSGDQPIVVVLQDAGAGHIKSVARWR